MTPDFYSRSVALSSGTIVHEHPGGLAVGDVFYGYSRGRIYQMTARKVTPTRVQGAYMTMSSDTVTAPWFKLSHTIDAPAPRPEGIALLSGQAPEPALARSWTVVAPAGRGGHRLEAVPA